MLESESKSLSQRINKKNRLFAFDLFLFFSISLGRWLAPPSGIFCDGQKLYENCKGSSYYIKVFFFLNLCKQDWSIHILNLEFFLQMDSKGKHTFHQKQKNNRLSKLLKNNSIYSCQNC